MKTTVRFHHFPVTTRTPHPSSRWQWCRLFLAAALLAGVGPSAGQTDDFEDDNDGVWTHYDPLGGLGAGPRGTWTEANGEYQLQALTSPAPATYGAARAASLRSQVYSNFYVAVDLVAWGAGLDQAIGILARIQDPGLGTTDGYVLSYQPVDQDVQISRINNEAAAGISPAIPVTLTPGQIHRLVFLGAGANLEGRVYVLPNTETPIVTVIATPDATYASGMNGLLVYDNSSGGASTAEATFDDYYADNVEPVAVTVERLPLDEVRVRWPVRPVPFTLQATATPAVPASWTDVTTGVQQQGAEMVYLEVLQTGARFFRVRK